MMLARIARPQGAECCPKWEDLLGHITLLRSPQIVFCKENRPEATARALEWPGSNLCDDNACSSSRGRLSPLRYGNAAERKHQGDDMEELQVFADDRNG